MSEQLAVNEAAERAVLGALLLLGDARHVSALLARGLRPEHFYWSKLGLIFSAAVSLADRSAAVDPITLVAELERLGMGGKVKRAEVEALAGDVPASGNYGQYADRVVELAQWRQRRRALYAMQAAQDALNAEAWSAASAELESVTGGTRSDSFSGEQWASLMWDYFATPAAEVMKQAIPIPFDRLNRALGGGIRPGEWCAVSGATSHGKALDLRTPIPTPAGWTTMGAIATGDEVYGPDGHPRRVLATSNVMEGRPCYCVRFSDGAEIVADAQHLWRVETHDSRSSAVAAMRHYGKQLSLGYHDQTHKITRAQIMTTEEMCGYAGSRRLSVPTADPLVCPEIDLLIGPYTLGAWLGDGSKHGAVLTAHADDAGHLAAQVTLEEGAHCNVALVPRVGHEHILQVRVTRRRDICRRGHEGRLNRFGHCRMCINQGGPGRSREDWTEFSVTERLAALGLICNKHIPEVYFRASASQRLSLLQGIVDTDGHVNGAGQVEVTLTNERLANDVRRLALTLGLRAIIGCDLAKLDGRVIGPRYRVRWVSCLPTARLPRKRDRLPMSVTTKATHRYVVSVQPVESRPVRCLQVDHRDGMFLAGEEFVATHNSLVVDAWADCAAKHGKRGHIYMTEMTAVSRGMRYLARRTGVPFMRQRNPEELTEADRQKIIAELKRGRFDYGVSIAADWDAADIVRDALRGRYDFVVVDLLHGFHYADERELDRLSKEMQRLARVSTTIDGHPGTAVIAVTHLKEEGMRNGKVPRPGIASIKGGSSIKQDADFVLFVWQEQDEGGAPSGDGEVWLAKGRSSALDCVKVRLNPARFRFEVRDDESDAPVAEGAPF